MTKMLHHNPLASAVAFITGSAVSITEFLSAGSVMLQMIGSAVALLGAYWIYVYWRTKAATQEYELKIKRKEWEQGLIPK